MTKLTPELLREKRDAARNQVLPGNGEFRGRITVHMGTCGIAAGARDVLSAVRDGLEKMPLSGIALTTSGCARLCSSEPMVTVELAGAPAVTYGELTPEKVQQILAKHVGQGTPLMEYAVGGGAEMPFFKKQLPLVLKNAGIIDPAKLEDYIARDGYTALEKALAKLTPDEVIEEIKRSGLRGRGGAGFPTGIKWQAGRREKSTPKYIIGNCDEGDPGAYMDRSLLESDPHSVVEGMIIGAYAIGASYGYVYVRSEYPVALQALQAAISQARQHGLLGEKILGFDFDFDMEIREGSGAFVCGEVTSLVHSIMGKSPEPRQRPPRSSKVGVWGCPTVINNVETLANVTTIVNRGAEWYSSIGTATSKGTKIFSLVGKITNTGLIEVPMGITLREIIHEIGGGIPGNKQFKAVQTGGPSGGCIPERLIDLPVDYESLEAAGSMMGSGAMIVMDEDTCMVDVSKFFIQFDNDESCGKCSACREGSEALLEILTRITNGEGREGDVEFLEELGAAVKDASMCGLGQSLPNPVLSTLQYFRDEYVAHIADKNCPAKVCKPLIKYYVDPDKCPGCGLCLKNCPSGAVKGELKHVHVIDQVACTKCGECLEVCPPKIQAVVKLSGKEARELKSLPAPVPVTEWRAQRAQERGTETSRS